MFLYGGSKPYPVSATPTAFAPQIGQFPTGEGFLSAFSFAYAGAKEKAIKKENADMRIDTYAEHVCRRRRDGVISRSAERDHRRRRLAQAFEKA